MSRRNNGYGATGGNGGQRRTGPRFRIETPKLSRTEIEFIGQLQHVHRELGLEGVRAYLTHTEEREGLKPGELAHLLSLFGGAP